MLRAEGNTPVTYQRFLELCRTAVSKTRYSELESLTLRSDKGPLVREWAKFYQAFSSELTFIRNEKRGLQFKGAYFHDTALSGAISAAISGKNPLEAENALIKLQFEKLDELVGAHCFDDHALMGYALKLRLLERKSIFVEKQGKDEFERILLELEKQITVGKRE